MRRALLLALALVATGGVAASAQTVPNPVHVYQDQYGEPCFYLSTQAPTCGPTR